MGQGASKSEPIDGEMKGPRSTLEQGLPPPAQSVLDSKRCATASLRSSNRAIMDDDAFGLDESQSRSTDSTQGSPEIGMYPSKAPKGRKVSSGCTASSRWFRRPSLCGGGTNKAETLKNDSLPPSYLVFNKQQQPEPPRHKSLPVIPNGKTVPVPVTRKSQSMKRMDNHNWGSHSDGGVGDPEARADELERMYDLRTWDMYLRITEARKSRPAASTMIPHQQQQQHLNKPIRAREDYDYFTPRDESFVESDPTEVAQSEELIFGDLE